MTALSEIAKYTSSIQELPQKDQSQLIRRKKRARRISQVSGGLSLAALAARTPQLARATAGRIPKLARTSAVKRVIAAEPRATNASNTLGVVSLGTGAIGSFNYAGIQRAETKADEKAIKKGIGFTGKVGAGKKARLKPTGRVRSFVDEQVGFVRKPTIAVNSAGQAKVMRHPKVAGDLPLSATTQVAAQPGGLASAFELKHSPQARVRKRDDKFLREYRDRISPDAENGYNTLRGTRNRLRTDAALATLSALGVPIVGAVPAYHTYKDAKRYQGHMDKIKARAYQRAADGQYGRSRPRPKVEKALVPTGALKPKVLNGTRAGGVVRRGMTTYTRRGSIVGTGRSL